MRTFTVRAGADQEVASFVAKRIWGREESWGNFNTLSIWDAKGLKAAVVYNHFVWPDILMHIGVRERALWARPEMLYHFFGYPFLQLRCKRVTGLVAAHREACVEMCKSVGFTQEGLMRRADPTGQDVIVFGMLKEECRWLDYKERKAA